MSKSSVLLRFSAPLLALAVLVCSAASGAARAQPTRDTVALTFWLPLGDPVARSLIVPYFRRFEKSHLGITIKYVVVSADNNWAKYTTAMAAGRGPDFLMTYSFNPPIPEWAANGLIQPLDPWFKQLHVSKDQWLPWIWKNQVFHNHVWGFMQQYDTTLFVWNKDDFRKAGLDPNRPPRTIAELDAYAKKLTKFDAKGNLVQAGFVPWIWPTGGYFPELWPVLFGGGLYDPVHHKYTINTPANVRALAWYGKYARMLGGAEQVSGFRGRFTGNNEPFYSGRVAMAIVGEWAPYVFKLYAPHLKYGAAAPPTAPGVLYGTNLAMGGDTFALPVGAKHPKEAAEVMLYMMQPDPVMAWCIRETNMPPTRAAMFDSRYIKGVPTNASAVETARLALKNPRMLVGSSTSAIVDYVNSQYGMAEQQVEYGRMSAKAALAQVQKLVDLRQEKVKRSNPGWFGAAH